MTTETRKKGLGGRLSFAPTKTQRAAVQKMAGFMMPHEEICRAVIDRRTQQPIDAKTLRKHFRDELDNGRAVVKAAICGTLLSRAKTDASGAVAIFLGKTVLGLKEVNVHEHTGKNGGPIEMKDARKRNLALVESVAGRTAGEPAGAAKG
jgi:hypothetical protein